MSCGNIARDNVLDPLNPDSTHPRKHLIEAFVNISDHPSQYNQWMLEALVDLQSQNEEDLIVAVYHRTIDEFDDQDVSPVCDIRYADLLEALDEDDAIAGVPDVFINGTSQRIQGASSAETALGRLQVAVHDEIPQNHQFYMNVQIGQIDTNLNATVTLARLGNQSTNDLRIQAMILSDLNGVYRKQVVRDLKLSDLISHLDAGELKHIEITGLTINPNESQHLVIAVINDEGSYVYQAETIQITQ